MSSTAPQSYASSALANPSTRAKARPSHWPVADWEAWLRALAPAPTPLDPPGRGAHLSPVTLASYELAFGNYLKWLHARSAVPMDAPLADRAAPALIAAWLSETRRRVRAQTAFLALEAVVRVLDLIEPSPDWKMLRRLPDRPTPAERRASRKPLELLPDGAQLLDDALALCDELTRKPVGLRKAVAFRRALLVAFATLHPFRCRSLTEIELGSGLERITADVWRLQIDATKLKTGFNVRLADCLVPPLEHYLAVVRPFLMGGDATAHPRLWVAKDGSPLHGSGLRMDFREIGMQLVGVPVNPHRVRHVAATEQLSRDPRCLALVTAVLGNRSEAAVNSTYDRSSREASLAIWRDVKARARRGGFER